ncbi:MAG: hypothetical protein AAF578_10100 [Pseudomonadota bacterium]
MRGDDIDTTAFRLVFVPCAMLALVLIVTMLDWKDDPKGSWTALSTMAVCVAAVVAVFVYRQTAERNDEDAAYRRSERLLIECKDILSQAVNRFVGVDSKQPPSNDPLLWLGVARSLRTYLRLASKIENEVHQDIVRVHEDDARAAIYNVFRLHGKTAFTSAYFSDSDTSPPASRAPVTYASIAAIFAFASWRGDASDPMDEIDIFAVFSKTSVKQYPGLVSYIKSNAKYAAALSQANED